MAKCIFLDDPITKEDWDQINALKFPTKVGLLISRLYERNNEPIFTSTLPPAFISIAQQANGIFLKARLPYRVSLAERHQHYPDLTKRRLKLYKVISRGRRKTNSLFGEDTTKEFAIRGSCCLMKDGSIRISLCPSSSTAETNELKEAILITKPKSTRIFSPAGRTDVVIELKAPKA